MRALAAFALVLLAGCAPSNLFKAVETRVAEANFASSSPVIETRGGVFRRTDVQLFSVTASVPEAEIYASFDPDQTPSWDDLGPLGSTIQLGNSPAAIDFYSLSGTALEAVYRVTAQAGWKGQRSQIASADFYFVGDLGPRWSANLGNLVGSGLPGAVTSEAVDTAGNRFVAGSYGTGTSASGWIARLKGDGQIAAKWALGSGTEVTGLVWDSAEGALFAVGNFLTNSSQGFPGGLSAAPPSGVSTAGFVARIPFGLTSTTWVRAAAFESRYRGLTVAQGASASTLVLVGWGKLTAATSPAYQVVVGGATAAQNLAFASARTTAASLGFLAEYTLTGDPLQIVAATSSVASDQDGWEAVAALPEDGLSAPNRRVAVAGWYQGTNLLLDTALPSASTAARGLFFTLNLAAAPGSQELWHSVATPTSAGDSMKLHALTVWNEGTSGPYRVTAGGEVTGTSDWTWPGGAHYTGMLASGTSAFVTQWDETQAVIWTTGSTGSVETTLGALAARNDGQIGVAVNAIGDNWCWAGIGMTIGAPISNAGLFRFDVNGTNTAYHSLWGQYVDSTGIPTGGTAGLQAGALVWGPQDEFTLGAAAQDGTSPASRVDPPGLRAGVTGVQTPWAVRLFD